MSPCVTSMSRCASLASSIGTNNHFCDSANCGPRMTSAYTGCGNRLIMRLGWRTPRQLLAQMFCLEYNVCMRLAVPLKLLPLPEQAALLHDTLHQANSAANAISALAWRERTFGQFKLHRLVYAQTR